MFLNIFIPCNLSIYKYNKFLRATKNQQKSGTSYFIDIKSSHREKYKFQFYFRFNFHLCVHI